MRNKFDTIYTRPEDVKRDWLLIDASEQYLGRMASQIAALLRGKHKTCFQPSVDTGDNVVVLNTSKIRVSGRKTTDKLYFWHTGFPGGIKSTNFAALQKKDANKVLRLAVKRMLPSGPLGSAMLKKLFLYEDGDHNQIAQKPIPIELKN